MNAVAGCSKIIPEFNNAICVCALPFSFLKNLNSYCDIDFLLLVFIKDTYLSLPMIMDTHDIFPAF